MPFIPRIKHSGDVSNFDVEFTSQPLRETHPESYNELQEVIENKFSDFTFEDHLLVRAPKDFEEPI